MKNYLAALTAAIAMICTCLTAIAAEPHLSGQAAMNFVAADIESVIRAVGHYTGNLFIIDPRVKGTINLVSDKPLSKEQTLQLLASTLRVQGYAMVRTEDYIKIVPEADAKLQAAPIVKGTLRGDQIATQIFKLNHESANNLLNVLRPLVSPNNSVTANPGNNSLVITDYADNLKRIARVIAALDNPATGEWENLKLINAIASEIAPIVNRLLDQSANSTDTGRTIVIAEPRTNSIIIRAPNAARAVLARQLIASLDVPTTQPGNVHVVYLKNAEAVKLAPLLRAIYAGDSAGSANTAQGSPTQNLMPGAQASAAINPFQGAGSASFIQADATTNTLIISANEQVYRNLRYVIDQLDARRAQVFVESLIVEVGADKAAELGIQWGAMSGDSLSSVRVGVLNSFSSGTSNIGSLFTNSANNLGNLFSAQSGGKPPAGGFSGALFQQKNGEPKLALLARALETDAKANILSMPNLITLDNEEARIMVGQNVPLITGQYTTAAGAGAGAVNPFQTIERRDIGLSLRVRPTISEGGTVKMAIYQETSSIQETTTSGLITSKRSIETHVLADDGQIIVLGGLLEDKVSTTIEKIPGLGNLPLIGNLFRYKKQQSGKTSLMVFLRPSVIRDDGQRLSMDRYDYLRSMQELSRPEPSTLLPKLSTPVLPPKELINRGTPIVPLQEENR